LKLILNIVRILYKTNQNKISNLISSQLNVKELIENKKKSNDTKLKKNKILQVIITAHN
jgi:hypothetical protein